VIVVKNLPGLRQNKNFTHQKVLIMPQPVVRACRAKHKAARQGGGGDRGGNFRSGGGDRGPRQMFTVTCAECGKETTVPFQPKGDRPVYCRECFDKRRDGGQAEGGPSDNSQAA